jgi:hypothetical protein
MSDRSHPPTPAPLSDPDAMAAAIGRVLARRPSGWSLLWSAAPTALLDLPQASSPAARWRAAPAGAKTLLSGVAGARGSVLTVVGEVLFAYEGANPTATLRPVIDARAAAVGTPPIERTVRPKLTTLATGLRDARRVAAEVAAELGTELPEALTRALQAAVRARARAEVTFDAVQPRLVVLASQHSTASRSLIHAARRRGIPTAYLAHAPAADTYQYRDLPTDFAGLRGAREVDFYRSLGAVRAPAVVGNPQAHVEVPAHLDASGSVIFAPRPQPPDQVRAQVALVDAVAPDVVVSTHPRMRGKARYAGLWPAHWEEHDGWTVDLLRGDHPCTIQMSSGVAWEAMAHGVPVIELSSPGGPPPSYLVIREPHARICATEAELAAAVAAARVDAVDPAARERLRGWASEWCTATGSDAVALTVAWIDDCLAAGDAPGPLLDHWAA